MGKAHEDSIRAKRLHRLSLRCEFRVAYAGVERRHDPKLGARSLNLSKVLPLSKELSSLLVGNAQKVLARRRADDAQQGLVVHDDDFRSPVGDHFPPASRADRHGLAAILAALRIARQCEFHALRLLLVGRLSGELSLEHRVVLEQIAQRRLERGNAGDFGVESLDHLRVKLGIGLEDQIKRRSALVVSDLAGDTQGFAFTRRVQRDLPAALRVRRGRLQSLPELHRHLRGLGRLVEDKLAGNRVQVRRLVVVPGLAVERASGGA